MQSFVLAAGAGGGADFESPRVLALKQRVGFDAAVASERLDEYVAITLKDFTAPDRLRDWSLDRELVPADGAELALRLRFTRAEGRVTVRAFVYPAAERGAVARRLLERADAVTTIDITDTKGPADLGTLALTGENGAGELVYWMYRNVYAEVATHRTDVSALEVARSLQAVFQKCLRAR